MSSNRNNSQTVKVTSIARKIHWMSIRGRLGGIIALSVFMIIFIFLCYVLYNELITIGRIDLDYNRSIEYNRELYQLMYIVAGNGKELLRLELFPAGIIVIAPVCLIMVLRILNILLGYVKEHRKIRKILQPINELALKADKLSRMSFSEEKYHILEDVIDNIDPNEEKELSFADSELSGVEAAMNNLLIRMRESYKQQARFVNDASHELRTPIAVIEGYANMLDRWGKDDAKILDESITAIKNESSHMKHLVEQLLFLARGDSGRTVLKLENTSLDSLMQEVYEESLMIDENHLYRYHRPESEVSANVDPGMFKQAVRILVDNSAKYTREKEEIILSTGYNEEGCPFVQVQDLGIGMAENDVKNMFERFYRSDDVRQYKGTGLGLSISKWIIDKHKGHFEIISRPGLGTRITIVLPRE